MTDINLLKDTDPERSSSNEEREKKAPGTIRMHAPDQKKQGGGSSEHHAAPQTLGARIRHFFRGRNKPRIISEQLETGGNTAPKPAERSAKQTIEEVQSPDVHVAPTSGEKTDDEVHKQSPNWSGSMGALRTDRQPGTPQSSAGQKETVPQQGAPVAPPDDLQSTDPVPSQGTQIPTPTPRSDVPATHAEGNGKNTTPSPPPTGPHIPSSPSGPSLPGVNLIPEEALQQVRRPIKELITIGAWAGVSLLVGVLVYVGLVLYEGNLRGQTEDAMQQIVAVKNEIETYDDVRTAANDLRAVTERVTVLLDRHVYWTKFLRLLEESTVSDVSFQGFSGTTSGALSLSATGTDFTSVTRQIRAFQDASTFVKSVSVLSASLVGTTQTPGEQEPVGAQTESSFTVQLEFQPGVYYQSRDEAIAQSSPAPVLTPTVTR